MSTTATPNIDLRTLLTPSEPRSPEKCHTIDHRGYALCGAFRRAVDETGDWDRGGLHSRAQCKARGHKHCLVCDEMRRQLKGDWIVG